MSSVTVSDRLAPLVGGMVRAAETDIGRGIVAGHDEDYEVSAAGETGTIVRMREGKLSLVDVSEGQPGFCAYTRVIFDPAAVPQIVEGTLTPAEAADNGGMLMRSRLYGGGQFMGLLRLAQKLDLLQG